MPSPARSHAAPASPAGSDFAASLQGSLPGVAAPRAVSLAVRRANDDKTVSIVVSLGESSGLSGGSFTFLVPAADLVLSATGATLDTHADLGRYGHIAVRWTTTGRPAYISMPADPCLGLAATTVTRAVSVAAAKLDLSLPCEGALHATLGSQASYLYSGTNVSLPRSGDVSQLATYATNVSAAKAAAPSAGVSIDAGASSGGGTVRLTAYAGSNAALGLVAYRTFAGDALPSTGLTTDATGTVTLAYSGHLGKAHLVFTGTGIPRTVSVIGRCSGASTQDATTVSEQLSDASVQGSLAMAACGLRQATFAAGDRGAILTYGRALSAAAQSDPLPAIGSGNVPGITSVTPPPGAVLSPSPTLTVTFALPLPTGASIVIMLRSSSKPGPVADPVVRGNTATIALLPQQSLKPGTYILSVGVTTLSGGSVFYKATYTVRAAPTPVVGPTVLPTKPLPGVTIIGTFPTVVQMSPPPGGRMSPTSPIVVTFAAPLPADASVEAVVLATDASGAPVAAELPEMKDPIVKGRTVIVQPASPMKPGHYLLRLIASDGENVTSFKAPFVVG